MTAPSHPWLAAVLDVVMQPLWPTRERVVPQASGRVLEIGIGTGLNLALYRDLEALVGIEPDPHMLARARARAERLPFPTELHQIGAESLPFDAASFDTVVVTFTLCTIPDPQGALAEVRRVIKPGGRVLFAEHVRSSRPLLARVQTTITPLWRRIGGGCQLDRPSVELLGQAGFAIESMEPFGRPDWSLVPVYFGAAAPRA